MPDDIPRTEARIAPQDCSDMPMLRGQIDRLDRALIALLKERLGYIERAAVIKQRRDAVHDDARIEDVVAKVRRAAEDAAYPPEIAEALWRELIARSITHEFEHFDRKTG